MSVVRQLLRDYKNEILDGNSLCEAAALLAVEAEFKTMQSRLESLEKVLEEEIKERDYREEVIDKLLDMVLGEDRAEWSSNYDFEDALIDVETATFCINEMIAMRSSCEMVTGGSQHANSATIFFKDRSDCHKWLKSVDDLTNSAMQARKGGE